MYKNNNSMKAITVILSICLCTGIMQAQETNSRSFVKQYSGKEGFRATTLDRVAIKMTSLLAKISAPKDEVSFLSNINTIQILELSVLQYKKHILPLENAFAEFCKTGHYEKLLETEKSGGMEQIFCRFEEDDITELIVWSKQKNSAEIVCLSGSFTQENIKKVLSKENKHIIGLN